MFPDSRGLIARADDDVIIFCIFYLLYLKKYYNLYNNQ